MLELISNINFFTLSVVYFYFYLVFELSVIDSF